MLNPNGTVYTANLRGPTRRTLHLRHQWHGGLFEPRFTFHGFRYVEVTGLTVPPTLNSVTGMVVHSEMPGPAP